MEVMDSTRSWSSTSCRKVGLWDGTACQHSLMIMYLKRHSRRGGQPGGLNRGVCVACVVCVVCVRHIQLMCAVGGFVHSVSLLQQLEELLHRDPWVGRPPQGEDLPHQDPVGPPGHRWEQM